MLCVAVPRLAGIEVFDAPLAWAAPSAAVLTRTEQHRSSCYLSGGEGGGGDGLCSPWNALIVHIAVGVKFTGAASCSQMASLGNAGPLEPG